MEREDGPRPTGLFIKPSARFHRSDAAFLDQDTGELVDAGYRFARVWTANESSTEGYAGLLIFGRDAGGLVYAGSVGCWTSPGCCRRRCGRRSPRWSRPASTRPDRACPAGCAASSPGSRRPGPTFLRELLWSTAGHIARVEEELSGPLAAALRVAALAQHGAAAEVVSAVMFDGPEARTALGAAAWDAGVASKGIWRAIDGGAAETELAEWATVLVHAAASADPETGWHRWDWQDDQLRAVAALAVMWGHALRADPARRADADAAFAAALPGDVGRRLQQLLLGPVVASDLVRLLRQLGESDLLPRVVEGIVPCRSWPTEPSALWREYVALLSCAADQLEGLPRDRDAKAEQLRSVAEAVRALPARGLIATLGIEDRLPPLDVHPATIVDLLRLDLTAVPEVAEALRQRLQRGPTGRPDASLARRRSRMARGASRRAQEPSLLLGTQPPGRVPVVRRARPGAVLVAP